MSYYLDTFKKCGFSTMYEFILQGKIEPNEDTLNKALEDLVTMLSQMNAGQRGQKGTVNVEENFDMTIITIVCETLAKKYWKGEGK